MIRLVDVILHSVLGPPEEPKEADDHPEHTVTLRREIAWVLQAASFLGRSRLAKVTEGTWAEGWLHLDTEEAVGRVLEIIGEDCRVVFA